MNVSELVVMGLVNMTGGKMAGAVFTRDNIPTQLAVTTWSRVTC